MKMFGLFVTIALVLPLAACERRDRCDSGGWCDGNAGLRLLPRSRLPAQQLLRSARHLRDPRARSRPDAAAGGTGGTGTGGFPGVGGAPGA